MSTILSSVKIFVSLIVYKTKNHKKVRFSLFFTFFDRLFLNKYQRYRNFHWWQNCWHNVCLSPWIFTDFLTQFEIQNFVSPPLVTPLHKNAPTPTRQTRLLGIPKTHRTYPGSMGHGNFNYQNVLGTRTIRNNLLKTLNLYFAQLSTAGLIIKKTH